MSIDFEQVRSLLKPLREWVEVYEPLEEYDSIEELQEISNEFIWAVVSVDSEELWIIPRSDVSEISEIVRWLVSDKPSSYDGLGILCEIRFFIDAMSREEGVEEESERVEAYIDFFKILDDDSDENIKQNIGYYDF